MKRIDLHIHTIASPLDEDFEFDLGTLSSHISRNKLDAVAITNHNLFDYSNFTTIARQLPDVCVLPGIEISVKNYHVLVIANPANIGDFQQRCSKIPSIREGEDGISLAEFKDLFGDGSFIVIPHYKKKPAIPALDLIDLDNIVTALEVSSEKKWGFEHERASKPVVRFSDFRCGVNASVPWGKYTYVSVDEVTFSSIRLSFNDRTKFSITEKENYFELGPGLYASMGLNVVIGGRSSGKTYFLDKMYNSCDPNDVIYIRQFDIVKNAESKAFREQIADEAASIKSEYYEPMAAVSSAAMDLPSRDEIAKNIKNYVAELTEYADTSARDDTFSKCPIYSESRLAKMSATPESKVVQALITLINEDPSSNPLTNEINSLLGRENIIKLLRLSLERYKAKSLECKCIELANKITAKIKACLTTESNRPACPESPMVEAAKRIAYVDRLAKLRAETKSESVVNSTPIGKFTRVTRRVPYKNATALKKALGANSNLAGFLQMSDLNFVEGILAAEGVSDISYALFDIDVSLRNERNEDVSGGQKAEYLLFRALDKAASHDVVLIDEPESSFDNPFLNELIAREIKKISKKATVFIATHNNVLGVSIKPDGIVYTSIGDDEHRIYTCDSSSEMMLSSDGKTVKRDETLIRFMEAGGQAYKDRMPYYGFA